jgi:peptidoglycan/xylan/chitin deacetylase (PgdA/CDA1 family)
MGISTELFWRQVRFLQKHYRIVSMAEAIEMLRFGRVESPTVVLTFDDGYADNFVNLRAVAEETGIPLTLFIATQPVELQQEFQHDLINGIGGVFPLTWPQACYWNRGNVEFGSHTRTHFDCGSHDTAKLEWEIAGSRRDLEQHLGRPVELFAFPFGHKENISSEALELAAASYSHFVSGFGGDNHSRSQKDAQHLLRKNLYANPWELELDLQGVFDLIETVRRKIRKGRTKSASVQPEFHAALSGAISNGGGSETQLNLT